MSGKAGRAYSMLAVILLNTALLVVLLNLGAALVLAWSEPEEGALLHEREKLERVYPGRSWEEIRTLLEQTWGRSYVYEPFTQFKEGPVAGEGIAVGEEGFRLGGSAWPPPPGGLDVFVFGGSTTFGYGVADDETLPAALGRALGERGCPPGLTVYNLARSNYYSSQERILFEQLLVAGQVPHTAVLVDGLNEFVYPREEPKFTARLRYLMAEEDRQLVWRAAKTMPLVELVRRRVRRGSEVKEEAPADPAAVEAVLRRWRANRRLIEAAAREYGVHTLFVWQPVPVHGYDLAHHLFADGGSVEIPHRELLREGYRRMDERRRDSAELGEASNFLWLGDLQRDRREPLYVDRVHYTAAFTGEIAAAIADRLARGLCDLDPGSVEELASHG